jgi:hypothetical protein
MLPSNATMALALVIAAVLLALDWYLWRTGPVRPYPLADSGQRTPRTIKHPPPQRLPVELGVHIDPDWARKPSRQPDSGTGENEYADHI